MILNIIFSLFNRQFEFFQKLVFEKITLELDENIQIVITNIINGEKFKINFEFFQINVKTGKNKLLELFEYSDKFETEIEMPLVRLLFLPE